MTTDKTMTTDQLADLARQVVGRTERVPADDGQTLTLDDIREQVVRAAEAASAKKATDILILEVGPLVGITDFFLLLSAANDRLLGRVVEEVEAVLRTEHTRKPIGREGTKESGWIVLDFGDYVVHAFTDAQRQYYELERLWRDAEVVPFVDPLEPAADDVDG